MPKSKIEWTDYSINPVKGLCPMACSYCYARRMYKRFKWNPEIRYDDPGFTIADIQSIKKPSRIFVGSTMELFWDWPEIWMRDTFTIIRQFPQHTFIFLTKQPEELLRWSPFPSNCHIGVSVTNQEMHNRAIACLSGIKASVKFISYEPLLNEVKLDGAYDLSELQWVIIGQQTPVRKSTMPKIEWIRDIVDACDKARIPVFLKNNLRDFIYGEYGGKYKQVFKYSQDGGRELRQEFPVSK